MQEIKASGSPSAHLPNRLGIKGWIWGGNYTLERYQGGKMICDQDAVRKALDRLGPDYRIKTSLYAKAKQAAA